jgi:transcriptional regulator with XRE-family HTH domain
MTVGQRPTIRRRRLRSELRQRREEAGLTQEHVAAEMEWSLSKLVRIEAGTVGISTNDLRALLGLYGLRERNQVDEMLEMARAARQRMWWTGFKNSVGPAYLEFIGFVAEASAIRFFHPTVVPGPLQTEGYARAVIQDGATATLEPVDVDARVDIRMTLAGDVLSRSEPPEFTVVLDEAVVHRQTGGPAVMREQIAHLIALAARPHVRLAVLPFTAGAHPGLYGSFTLLEFTDPAEDTILYLENAPTDMILRDGPGEITRYASAFQRLLDRALGPEATVALLTDAANALS